MAEAEKPYQFRPYIEDDLNFIRSSWANSYYKGANYQDVLSPDEFHSYHRPIREKILSKPNIAMIVCESRSEPLTILGWILVEKPKCPGMILHYIYVKQALKGQGIAKELINLAFSVKPILITHMTEKAHRIMFKNKANYPHFQITPHLI